MEVAALLRSLTRCCTEFGVERRDSDVHAFRIWTGLARRTGSMAIRGQISYRFGAQPCHYEIVEGKAGCAFRSGRYPDTAPGRIPAAVASLQPMAGVPIRKGAPGQLSDKLTRSHRVAAFVDRRRT